MNLKHLKVGDPLFVVRPRGPRNEEMVYAGGVVDRVGRDYLYTSGPWPLNGAAFRRETGFQKGSNLRAFPTANDWMREQALEKKRGQVANMARKVGDLHPYLIEAEEADIDALHALLSKVMHAPSPQTPL